MEKYYNDYDTEPIGGGNPYHCCVHCKISVPEINGKLEGHAEECEFRKMMESRGKKLELKEENDWLKYLLEQVLSSLPQKRDWLDPDLEEAMRSINKG